MKRKKNEEYIESQITTIHIFGLKSYFAQKHGLKKSCLYLYIVKFYLQFLCVAGYLKHSNDTPKLNILKYTTYNIIEIFINRSSTTAQIFIVIYYSILMSEKYFLVSQRHVLKLERTSNNLSCIKVDNFRKSVNF